MLIVCLLRCKTPNALVVQPAGINEGAIKMQETKQNDETENGTEVAGQDKRFVMWLHEQWRQSFARAIWEDLTPFGRLTIWIPMWIICWLMLPFTLPLFLLFAGLDKLTTPVFKILRRSFLK